MTLLNSVAPSGVAVYRNTIPEGTTKPCFSANELANTSSRVISGKKYGLISTWRVSVYVKNDSEMQALLDILENLDNTSNNDFQKIFSQYVLTETRQSGAKLTRAFYDLTLYK